MEIMALLFGSLAVFLIIGVPIAFSVGLSLITTIAVWGEIPMMIVFQQTYQGLDSFTLLGAAPVHPGR